MGTPGLSEKFRTSTARAVALAVVTTMVVATTVYGLLKPLDLIDTRSSPPTTAVGGATPLARPEAVAVSGDLKSIGPKAIEADTEKLSIGETTAPAANKASSPSDSLAQTTTTTQSSKPAPPPSTAAPTTEARTSILGFALIDSKSGRQISLLGRRPTIERRSARNNVSIQAITSPATESVVFYLGSDTLRTQSEPPFDITAADGWMRNPGTYQLTANTYTEEGGKGASGTAYTSVITIV